MKVLVAAKRVMDYNVKVRLKADRTGVDLDNVKMSMNPFDEIAVEAAVQLKEAGRVSDIVLVSIGPAGCVETLRAGLAISADRGVHVQCDRDLEPLLVAKLLKGICDREQPHLVVLGKQAIDDDCNQTGQMLAALGGWPQGIFASKITLSNETVEVTREVGGGLETVSLRLPAVVTTDLRLNEPRYATLPAIMKAKKKPIEMLVPEALGVDVNPRTRTLRVDEPPKRKAGKKVGSGVV